jgi:hypothetical protein
MTSLSQRCNIIPAGNQSDRIRMMSTLGLSLFLDSYKHHAQAKDTMFMIYKNGTIYGIPVSGRAADDVRDSCTHV